MTEQVETNNSLIANPTQKDSEVCKNCSTPLTGPFCHQCGQPNKSIIRFFGSLIHELLEDIISLDSRAARTIFALLFKPGFLTREYVSGRRFFYVPPLRLFLLTSIFCIFFIWVLNKTSESAQVQFSGDNIVADQEISDEQYQEILDSLSEEPLATLSDEEKLKARKKLDAVNKALSFANNGKTVPIPPELKTAEELAQEKANALEPSDDKVGAKQPADSAKQIAAESDEKPSTPDPKADETQSPPGIKLEGSNVNVNLPFLSEEDNKQLEERLETNINKLKDPEEREDFWSDMLELIPKIMLLLVPIFAIMIKICYPFAKRYYIEHLIHAFHGHAFLFLAILISLGLEVSGDAMVASESFMVRAIGSIFGIAEVLMLIWIPIYFLISLRVVYQQNWFLTVWKWFLLGILYFILATFSTVVFLVLAVLFN